MPITKEAQGHIGYFLVFAQIWLLGNLEKPKQPPEWGVSPLAEHRGKKGKYRGSYKPIMMIEAKVKYLTPVGLRALEET